MFELESAGQKELSLALVAKFSDMLALSFHMSCFGTGRAWVAMSTFALKNKLV
jgi:hypothetical protein